MGTADKAIETRHVSSAVSQQTLDVNWIFNVLDDGSANNKAQCES